MIKLFNWFGGFFEDQKGSASSKRAILYFLVFILFRLSEAIIQGKIISIEFVYVVSGLILVFGGYVTSEFFADKKLKDLLP